MENRIKEQQLMLFADRTSAATLRANQLRLYYSSVAYVLLAALRRLGLAGTALARAMHHDPSHAHQDRRAHSHHRAQGLARAREWLSPCRALRAGARALAPMLTPHR
jgi:hypothetical protein